MQRADHLKTEEHRQHAAGERIHDAAGIPALGHAEAGKLAAVELDRFLTLVESLSAEDWERPTACTLWNVREVVAHQAGSAAGYARWSEFKRQYGPGAQRPYRRRDLSQLDATNQIQVDDRAGASPRELIAELREVGPRAIATRQRLPAVVRAIRLPAGAELAWLGPLGLAPLGYLTDVIYPRDMWMHRLDIARATGREFAQTRGHDGRIVALVLRDLARKLTPTLGDHSVVYELSGPAGGAWRVGRDPAPAATIGMTALDFNLLASGRLRPEDARSRALVSITGDVAVANRALESTEVPY